MLTINNTVLGENCQVPSFDVSIFEIQDGKVNLTKICLNACTWARIIVDKKSKFVVRYYSS